MKERDCAAGATGLTNTSVYLPSQPSGRKGLPHRWDVRCHPVTLGRLGELSPPEATVQAHGERDHHYGAWDTEPAHAPPAPTEHFSVC